MRLTDRELAAVLFGLRNLPRADSDTLTTQEIDDLCERLTGEDISAGAGRRGRSDALIEFLRRGHDRPADHRVERRRLHRLDLRPCRQRHRHRDHHHEIVHPREKAATRKRRRP